MLETSELFLSFVRRGLAFFFALLIALFAVALTGHAQNAGNVGIYTREVPVFTSQAASTSSAIFPDFGFGCSVLSYQTTGFEGTIDLDWTPPGTTTPIVLQQANYLVSADTGNHALTLGGYYPNLRSTVTRTAGSITAQYTAQANGCSPVAAGLGTNGSASPITCDQNAFVVVTGSSTGTLLASPTATGDTLIICAMTWSFNAATGAGQLGLAWTSTSACTGGSSGGWNAYTTASTPQFLVIPMSQRSVSSALAPYPCANNSSGANALVSISYASVHGL